MASLNDTLRILPVRDSSSLSLDLQALLLDAQARNLAPGSVRFYRQKLRPLVAFLEGCGVRHTEDVQVGHLRQWLVRLQMDLARAERLMETDPQKARKILAGAGLTASSTLGELRALSRGIAPPELVDDIWSRPGIWPNWRSSGAVTALVITSGLAPG